MGGWGSARTRPAVYASLTEREGRRVFWYTDRKMFVLGSYITDEMLAGLTVPS